jgi:hypothetical protein
MKKMTHHGRHEKRGRRPVVGPLVVAVAVVALLAGGVWGVTHYGGEEPTAKARTQTHTPALRAALAKATDTCRTARDLFTPDVVAMEGAIQQWRIHVAAMTQLTSGKIDLNQAQAFWNSTRVEGKRTLKLFDRVDHRYSTAQTHCGAPAGVDDAANASASELKTCEQRQAAVDVVLNDARKTLDDWRMHIKQMDALRAGTLNATRALHMWHAMYQRGKVELAQYDKDHRHLDRTADCPV